MQVTETLNEGLKRGYTITLEAAELDAKVNEKLDEHRETFQMKGFRKGKAPAALMKKMFGKSVMGEAMQEAIDEIPEVDFKKIKLTKLIVEPGDADIDDALNKLAEQAPHFEPRKKNSKAKDGDQLVIDFKGSVDGVEFDGGAAEDFPLVLGSNQFIPGFEEQLVGAKEGDTPSVEVTFPEQYGAAQLAGKAAVFAVTVKEVKEPKNAPIDDELAKKFGEEDLAKLKERLKERINAEYGQAARMVMKRALLDDLADATSFELPPSLVEAESKQIAHQLWHNDNPDVEGHDHPEIETTDEHVKLAERRVRLGLVQRARDAGSCFRSGPSVSRQ